MIHFFKKFFVNLCGVGAALVFVGADASDITVATAGKSTKDQALEALKNENVMKKSYALVRHGAPKYPENFTHFSSMNPNAPKGGTFKMGVVGSFDSTNPFIVKGVPPVGLSLVTEGLVYDTLMKRSPDEPFSLYPLIAEAVELAEDNSQITFYLNPKARFADDTPVLASDVIWTFETLREKGLPVVRSNYKRVESVEELGPHKVRFTFKKNDDGTYDAELPMVMAIMKVIPKEFYKERTFDKATLDFVMGSGPYLIDSIDPGHRIVYRRRDDYWAKDLPVNRGQYNFDRVEVRYFRDEHILRQAFKAGELNLIQEQKPQEWTRFYNFDRTKGGPIEKVEIRQNMPVPLVGLAFNLRRSPLDNPKVRRALSLIFDFDWINENLYEKVYERHTSFFNNLPFEPKDSYEIFMAKAQKSLPPKLFEKLKSLEEQEIQTGVLPKELRAGNAKEQFQKESRQEMRTRLLQAKNLLQEAGFVLEKGRLLDPKTKKQLTLELLIYQKAHEKIVLEFKRSLSRLGIDLKIRLLEPAQIEGRRTDFDFDMIFHAFFSTSRSPGVEQKFCWSSDFADIPGSRNIVGVKSKTIDMLIDHIVATKSRTELEILTIWLDRLLMSQDVVIPFGYSPKAYIAYEKVIQHPKLDADTPIHLVAWWYQGKTTK